MLKMIKTNSEMTKQYVQIQLFKSNYKVKK